VKRNNYRQNVINFNQVKFWFVKEQLNNGFMHTWSYMLQTSVDMFIVTNWPVLKVRMFIKKCNNEKNILVLVNIFVC
jgi:hypothetical protein